MDNENKQKRKILAKNILNYIAFGLKMYEDGVCDAPIKNAYKLEKDSEIYGITKRDAANMLNLSVRQFDRYVKAGIIQKGKKYRNKINLYWDEGYIRQVKTRLFS